METEPVTVDCAQVGRPDLAAIDRLARIRLAAQRRGRPLRLVNPTPPLLELISLCGLGCELAGDLRVEMWGQAEQRKEPGGVEEKRELADPPF